MIQLDDSRLDPTIQDGINTYLKSYIKADKIVQKNMNGPFLSKVNKQIYLPISIFYNVAEVDSLGAIDTYLKGHILRDNVVQVSNGRYFKSSINGTMYLPMTLFVNVAVTNYTTTVTIPNSGVAGIGTGNFDLSTGGSGGGVNPPTITSLFSFQSTASGPNPITPLITATNPTSLVWEITGDATGNYTGDSPALDFSGNTGTANVGVDGVNSVITVLSFLDTVAGADIFELSSLNVSPLTELKSLVLTGAASLSILDITSNTKLEELSIDGTSISVLDTSANPLLNSVNISGSNITSLNLSNNSLIVDLDVSDTSIDTLDVSGTRISSGDIDSLISVLVDNGISGGTLTIPDNRTAASDADSDTLIVDGWTITEVPLII